MMKNTCFGLVLVLCSYSLTAQTYTGTVSGDGSVVENALVLCDDDHSSWVKTGENGDFTLSGCASGTVNVSALHFETKRMISLSEGTGNNIQIDVDPKLQTDVYHISFDHLRPGDAYSLDELKEDFTVAYGKGFYDGSDAESNRAFVDKNESIDPNGTSLRVKFPKDKLKTADSGVDTRIYLSGNYKTGKDFTADELYISYWVKFQDGFDHRCGGKMPSLGGEFENTLDGGNDRWKGRIMWRNGGSIQFYPELPHAADNFEHDSLRFWGEKEFDGGDICTNEFTPYLQDGEWHNIELHYKLDDGVTPGVFEGWVDGGVGYKIIDSDVFGFYRRQGEGLENLTLNFIMISTFFGGSSVDYNPVRDEYAWFDEFRVSDSRIDEYNVYMNVLSSENNLVEKESTIYPNPTSGIIQMSQETSYAVTDMTGQTVLSGEGVQIDMSGLASGVYFVVTPFGQTKVVKQ